MADQELQDGRADLVSRLFAQLTSRFEDAAAIAAECQGSRPGEELTEGAERLRDIAHDAATVAEAIVELLGISPGRTSGTRYLAPKRPGSFALNGGRSKTLHSLSKAVIPTWLSILHFTRVGSQVQALPRLPSFQARSWNDGPSFRAGVFSG